MPWVIANSYVCILRWLLQLPRLLRVPKKALRASLLVSVLPRARFRRNRNILWKQSWQTSLTLTGLVSSTADVAPSAGVAGAAEGIAWAPSHDAVAH